MQKNRAVREWRIKKWISWGLGILTGLVLVSCGGEEPAGKPAKLGIMFDLPDGWETYYTAAEIIRLRKLNTEAIIDLSVVGFGPGGAHADFDAFFRQHSYVSGRSRITEVQDVLIDGARATRISFEGRRADTGEPTAGERYLLEHDAQGYFFVFLDAGDRIPAHRAEARKIIELIRFKR